MRLHLGEAPGRPAAQPAPALFRTGDAWSAYVVREGRARLVPVETGRRTGLLAEVLAGLAEGDRVIVHPGDAVEDGVRVRERPTGR